MIQAWVAVDLALTVIEGGRAIADLGVLRAEPELFGPAASDPTRWQALELIDAAALSRLRTARAAARAVMPDTIYGQRRLDP